MGICARTCFSDGRLSLSVAVLLIATSCGGGNSGVPPPPPPPPPAVCTVLASNLNILVNGLNGRSAGFVFQAQPVLDSTNVYWYEFDPTLGDTGGSIRSIPKNGGQVMVVASGLSGVNDIELDATNVYWTEFDIMAGNGAIKTAVKTGGTITVLATGTPPNGSNCDVFFPIGLAVDSTYVYWSDQCFDIRRVPKAGGTVVESGSPGSFPGVQRMAFDAAGTYLYFGTGSMPGSGEGVGRWPLSGPPQMLATGVGSNVVGGMALDSNFFYGASIDSTPNGNVFEVPIGGGAPIYVVPNLSDPQNVAIDTSNIYYAPSTGGVWKLPKTGGTPTEYPNCHSEPTGIAEVVLSMVAVDDASVYAMGKVDPTSTVGSGGMLVKFPK